MSNDLKDYDSRPNEGREAEGLPGQGRQVLVTGAGGFIGRHLVPSLLRDGWEVTALRRGGRSSSLPEAAGLRIVTGDLTDPATIERLVEPAAAVCHLAAFIPLALEDPSAAAACLEMNAMVALRIAEAAARAGTRLVFFSSGQVCRPSDRPVSEDAPTYPANRATYYLASKLAGELFVEHCRLVRGLAAFTLRVGSCYGFGMPEKSVVARFMRAAQAGQPLEVFDGGQGRSDYVAVEDVVDLARTALQGDAPGVYNAGSGRGESVLELAQTIQNVFDDRCVEIRVRPPASPGAPAAGFAPLAIEKAAAAWGYCPRSLIEGLREYRRLMETESACRGIQ